MKAMDRPQQGHIIGYGEVVVPFGKEKSSACVYEAVSPLCCHPCGRLVLPGERFTRGNRGVVLCWFCQQFCDPDREINSSVPPVILVEQLRERETLEQLRLEVERWERRRTLPRRQRPG